MTTLAEFNKIIDAEAYFEFFQLPYDAKVVNINRLHILKKFSQHIAEIDQDFPEIDETERLTQYRGALIQSYETFLKTSPLETKLFKVFNEKPKGIVMLSELSAD
ncbi:nitrogenase-stabilizing/protective protein NifW [Cyanobacteria bacterium FACHB-63]|nr:nitrogenase-stabilizing/protective protein NifW [Cyanobacteria bacterium FACHB-63]